MSHSYCEYRKTFPQLLSGSVECGPICNGPEVSDVRAAICANANGPYCPQKPCGSPAESRLHCHENPT